MPIPIDTATGKPMGKVYDGHPDACEGRGVIDGSAKCPRRATCQLYADHGIVQGSVITSCQDGRQWPLYRQIQPEAE